ncbi:hypothetical protein [Erythrobacter sp. R86502]|uniref:hypothetical protein n=1 Tax=Erythrobacter sp. R86502 TaxID=3093846 RepID=UPI0036D252DD
MLTQLLVAALMLQSAPAPAVPVPVPMPAPASLSQENRALLRCATAFALVAQGQAAGEPQALQWPDLSLRGREFFVRALAQLMDASGADRDAIAVLANAEARALTASGEVPAIMPSCLLMLEAAKL